MAQSQRMRHRGSHLDEVDNPGYASDSTAGLLEQIRSGEDPGSKPRTFKAGLGKGRGLDDRSHFASPTCNNIRANTGLI